MPSARSSLNPEISIDFRFEGNRPTLRTAVALLLLVTPATAAVYQLNFSTASTQCSETGLLLGECPSDWRWPSLTGSVTIDTAWTGMGGILLSWEGNILSSAEKYTILTATSATAQGTRTIAGTDITLDWSWFGIADVTGFLAHVFGSTLYSGQMRLTIGDRGEALDYAGDNMQGGSNDPVIHPSYTGDIYRFGPDPRWTTTVLVAAPLPASLWLLLAAVVLLSAKSLTASRTRSARI